MRVRRLFWLFAFAAAPGGLAACALISGLSDYSSLGGDASSTTKATQNDGNPSPPAEDGPAAGDDDAADGSNPAIEAGTETGGDADAESNGKTDGQTDANADVGAGEASVPDASDAAPRMDSGEAGPPPSDGGDGGCKTVVHSNGVGQMYTDCVPLDTYGAAQAASACQAAGGGTCAQNPTVCFPSPSPECVQGASSCDCWAYTGAAAGHVSSTASGAYCICPASSDPAWH